MFKKLLPLLFLFAGFQANATLIDNVDYGGSPVFNATLTGTTGAGHWRVNEIQFGAGVDFSAQFRLVGWAEGHPRSFYLHDIVLTIGSETSIPFYPPHSVIMEFDIQDRELTFDTTHNHQFYLKLNRWGDIKPPLPYQSPPAILWHISDIVGDYKGDFLIDSISWLDISSCLCPSDTRYHEIVSFSIVAVPDHSIIDVPEPSIIALFGLGLAGLGFARRRRQA
jgi:hypothetical protein